ncbi:right-handed parallel beta-helix repeat-containing protein [Salinirubrum litoreum]|uniref:Right-handed parallel beta-helix repeat-containing protein n=1 Tax=Salinirubrum litoreum TaxID=1126234 RepID=A0ABD5RCY7_9EURY
MSEHRLRALVLAVLMVTSVVAGSGVAVAGGSGGNSTLVVDAAGNAQQDGVYNDIQPAVDAATAGETVEVEATGTYDPFTVKKELTVTAAGDTAPEVTGDGPAVVQVEGAGAGTTISGLKLTGAATLGVEVRADRTTVRNTVISGPVTGVQTQDDAANGDGLDGVLVENNAISDGKVGVSVTENAGKTVTVRGNQITDVTVEGIGVAGTAEVVESNSVTTTNDVPGVRFYGGTPSEVNGVTGDKTDIATAVLTDNDGISSVAFKQSGETVSRAVENTDTGTYYASIQTAVDDAEPGATISVASGTYQEAVTVDKNLTLVGAGPSETTIKPDSAASSPAVLVAGHTPESGDSVGSVTLKGLSAVAPDGVSGVATYGETASDDYDTKSLTVENVHVDGSAGYGVTLTSTAEATLSDVSVTGVTSDSVGAVEAVGVGDLSIAGSTVSDNGVGVNVFTLDGYGAVDAVSITGTTFSNNGVHVRDTTDTVDPDTVATNNEFDQAVVGPTAAGGDGIWSNVQPAIDAAPKDATIDVYPGSYEESATERSVDDSDPVYSFGLFVDTPGLTIQGVDESGSPVTDRSSVAAKVTSTENSMFGTNGAYVDADGVTFSGIELHPDPESSANKNLEVGADGFTLKNSVVTTGQTGVSSSVYFDSADVQSFSVTDSKLTGSLVVSNGAGNQTDASTRTVTGNELTSVGLQGRVKNIPWLNYEVGGVTVKDNHFVGDVTHYSVVDETVDATHVDTILSENNFENSVVVRTPDGDVRTQIYSGTYQEKPYDYEYVSIGSSIQSGVDAAQSGDTVSVGPGTYEESLDVRKDLTLAGSGEGETVIDTDDSMDYGLLTTADVTLRDFTLRGPSAAADYTYGIKSQFATTSDGFERTDVHIEDVTVTNSYKTEIDLNGVGSAALVDVTADGAGTRGAGVALSDTQDVLIKDVTTTGNNWGGLAVYTNPRTDVPIGTDNVTLAGDNSFENGVYLQGDLSKITNVDAPAYAEYKASDGTSLTLFFGTQDEATNYVSAQKAPDDWLITALGDESGDGEEDDETYTVAPGQSVSATVDKVPTGSTVVVDKETIDESITLSKSVSLVAGDASSGSVSISADATSPSRPTITSSVSINNYAEDVTISGFAFDVSEGGQINANGAGDGLEIRNNVFEGGSPEGGSVVAHGGESRAQLETGAQSDWVVADNEFSDIDGTALRLWNLQSVTVENNTFEDLTGSAVSHIGVDETTVRNNSFETVDKAGVYVDGWSKISSLGVQDVTVENNTFNETGALDGEYDQGGVNVGGTVDDLSEITIRANDFESGQFGVHVADDAQDATGSIQASLNYWNASSGPSGVAGGEGVPVTAGVTVSPSLPEPTSEYEDVREVTGGTYSVTVPADGEPRVVAFPADVEGTAGDVFGNFSGNVFAYDAATGSWDRVENASREVDALDAFVVVPAENASDVTISYTLASSATDAPSVPPEADLDAGWNLVGAPQFGAADEAFGASTADPARVLKTYRGPTGEPFAPGFESATGVVGDTDAVSPFEGYWVYATENGTLAGNVPPGTDASDLEDLLKEA